MAITEEQRHRLFQALEEVLGHEPTVTLMEHLPPVGWADVATKRDLDALGQRMDRFEIRMDGFETRLTDGFDRMHRDMRLQLYWLLGFFASAVGVIVAVVGS